MAPNSEKDLAKILANRARGNIKAKRLLRVGVGNRFIDTFIRSAYLSEKPFLTYLTKDEQPHFFFTMNQKAYQWVIKESEVVGKETIVMECGSRI
jgi:hypothetical protein